MFFVLNWMIYEEVETLYVKFVSSGLWFYIYAIIFIIYIYKYIP